MLAMPILAILHDHNSIITYLLLPTYSRTSLPRVNYLWMSEFFFFSYNYNKYSQFIIFISYLYLFQPIISYGRLT